MECKFVVPPLEEKEQEQFFTFAMAVWLKQQLAAGTFTPTPKPEVIPGGFGAIDAALDKLKGGVSNTKLVVEV